MPSLEQLLEDTMMFTAARTLGLEPVPIGVRFQCPTPKPFAQGDLDEEGGGAQLDPALIQANPIWEFEYDPTVPGVFTNLRVWHRGMGMDYSATAKVLTRLEFRDVQVRRADGDLVELPIDPTYTLGAWWLRTGKIEPGDKGWWQLEARTDVSVVVALGYASQDGVLRPIMPYERLELAESFMPRAGAKPELPEFEVEGNTDVLVSIGPTRYLVLLTLTTCTERADFAPGEMVGMARFLPHAMVMSNVVLETVEVSIAFERPAKAMTHGDPEMKDEIKSLLVSDSNRNHTFVLSEVPGLQDLPIPVTSNIFDYYVVDAHERFRDRTPVRTDERGPARKYQEDHPAQRAGEVCMVDDRFRSPRTVESCVWRDGGDAEAIVKRAGQGQFDNVHLAPRMRLEFLEGRHSKMYRPPERIVLDDIAMVFVCMHDCMHMHTRWARFSTDKPTRGFQGKTPNRVAGAPMVPDNQAVFMSFPSEHSLVYRAVAHGCEAGEWQVFCHHGAAYAIGEWPSGQGMKNRFALKASVFAIEAPLDLIYPEMGNSWAAFYWRCRWTGSGATPRIPAPRLQFDLDRCMR